MNKQVLILKGSPRAKGNSAILADRAADGASEAGANVESIFIQSLIIKPCASCDRCHIEGKGCVLDDDMQQIYPKLRQADSILISSPIFWFTYSAQTKLVVDRWYALLEKGGHALKDKLFGIILTYGDTDLYTSGGINAIHTFDSMFRYIGADVAGYVYGTAGSAGDVKNSPDLMQKAFELGKKLGTGK